MSSPNRRLVIVGAVALGAAALGAVVAARRGGAAGAAAASAAAAASPPASAPGSVTTLAALMPAQLPLLGGRVLTAADWSGRPLVLNFWAPWCAPCVKELPELDRFAQAEAKRGAAGAQVLGLAIDEAAAVGEFLARHPVSYPIAVLGFAGLAWVRKLGNDPSVGLPFSAQFDASGALAHRKFGPTDAAELSRWTAAS